ncbi:MAG: XRE family transcriptional regulator [Pseudomonadota bacterium]
MKVTQGSANVFDDLGFDEAEAALLKEKSDLAIALRKAVGKANLTQKRAAELTGMSRPTLNRVFKGDLRSVSMDRLITASHMLGVKRTTSHKLTLKKAVA